MAERTLLKRLIVFTIWRWNEDAQVDKPGSSVELGEDVLDAEVVQVAWARLDGLYDDVANHRLK